MCKGFFTLFIHYIHVFMCINDYLHNLDTRIDVYSYVNDFLH